MTSQERTRRSSEAESHLILIADDEEPIMELLETFVTDLGYIPLGARNGQEALMLARRRWPALVITDQMMPVMNGADLLTALRAEATAQGRAYPLSRS